MVKRGKIVKICGRYGDWSKYAPELNEQLLSRTFVKIRPWSTMIDTAVSFHHDQELVRMGKPGLELTGIHIYHDLTLIRVFLGPSPSVISGNKIQNHHRWRHSWDLENENCAPKSSYFFERGVQMKAKEPNRIKISELLIMDKPSLWFHSCNQLEISQGRRFGIGTGIPTDSLLVPIQRTCKYKILFQDLIKNAHGPTV